MWRIELSDTIYQQARNIAQARGETTLQIVQRVFDIGLNILAIAAKPGVRIVVHDGDREVELKLAK